MANTAAAETQVAFTLLTEAGTSRTVHDTVTANGRYSLDVAGTFPYYCEPHCAMNMRGEIIVE